MLEAGNGIFHLFHCNRPFFKGAQNAGTQFILNESFTPVIGFDNPGVTELGCLISGKTLFAFQAFTSTPDLIPLVGQPGIDDPRILK